MDATMRKYLDAPEGFGFHWVVEDVRKRSGPNNSDMRVVGQAPILVVDDLEKFITEFGKDTVLAALDGSSFRVQSQTERDNLAANPGTTLDTMKERIIQRIRGIKRRTVRTVEKRIYVASDGTEFEDKAEMLEYEQALREEA